MSDNEKKIDAKLREIIKNKDMHSRFLLEKIEALEKRFEQSRVQDNVSWKGFRNKYGDLLNQIAELKEQEYLNVGEIRNIKQDFHELREVLRELFQRMGDNEDLSVIGYDLLEKLDASSASHTVKKEKTDALDSLLHGIDPAFLKTEKKEHECRYKKELEEVEKARAITVDVPDSWIIKDDLEGM